jgi:4-hydroxyphenylpyruvate dioxygenase
VSTFSPDPKPAVPALPHDDPMPLHGIDHVELYVGNAKQAAYFFTRAYGFTEVAYAGLETGRRDRVSHVLQQGRVRLVLTGTLGSDSDIARHHAKHGDGVKVIAISVPDVEHAYAHATAAGAVGLRSPHADVDVHGSVVTADVATYGETIHRFVARSTHPSRTRATSRRAGCSSRSTTSSATSSSARWTSGSRTTRTSSA